MKFQVFASIIIGIGFVFEGVIAKLTVKEPTQDTVWRAGANAEVAWDNGGAFDQKITIEVYPANDALNPTQRIVAVLADRFDAGNANIFKFKVPDNIPAWSYALRMRNINDPDAEYSYSAMFLISDTNGKTVDVRGKEEFSEEEPEFPSAEKPNLCMEVDGSGNCENSANNNGTDPRDIYGKNSAQLISNSNWAIFPAILFLCMFHI